MTSEQGRKGLAEVLSDNAEGILVGVLAVAVAAALTVGGFYVVFFKEVPVSGDPASWGQLGDYLGGVLNPVFGFLSVFALLVALVLQTRELKLSRESLKLSREELKLSRDEQAKAAEALALQNKAIQQQSFEQTFFSMLKLLSDLLDGIVFRGPTLDVLPSQPTKGNKALRSISDALRRNVDRGDNAEPYRDYVAISMGEILHSASLYRGLSEYARTLGVVLDYLDASKVEPGEIYPKLLRSQMDREEVLFVYFLCFATGWEGLKRGVEQYGLLVNIDPDGTGVKNDFHTYFERTAFQGY